MPNQITFTAIPINTAKVVQFENPKARGTFLDGTLDANGNYVLTVTNVAAGTYSGLKAQLKGSNPLVQKTLAGVITVVDGSGSGGNQPYVLAPTVNDFSQNAGIAEMQSDGRIRNASFAVLEEETTDSSVGILVDSTGSSRTLSTYINDEFAQTFTGLGRNQLITLPVGTLGTKRRIKYVVGSADRDNEVGPIVGTTIKELRHSANTTSSFVKKIYTKGVLVIGDSISNSAAVSGAREREGWAPSLRSDEMAVFVSGYGSHTATVAFATQAARDIALGQVDAAKAECATLYIIIALETNDYAFAGVLPIDVAADPTTMATGVGLFMNMVHDKYPNMLFLIATATPRTDKTGLNALNYAMSDYDNALLNIVATRSSYSRAVYGADLLPVSQLSGDGLHPTTQGHATMRQNWATILSTAGSVVEAPFEWQTVRGRDTSVSSYSLTRSSGANGWNAYAPASAGLTRPPGTLIGEFARIRMRGVTADTAAIYLGVSALATLNATDNRTEMKLGLLVDDADAGFIQGPSLTPVGNLLNYNHPDGDYSIRFSPTQPVPALDLVFYHNRTEMVSGTETLRTLAGNVFDVTGNPAKLYFQAILYWGPTGRPAGTQQSRLTQATIQSAYLTAAF